MRGVRKAREEALYTRVSLRTLTPWRTTLQHCRVGSKSSSNDSNAIIRPILVEGNLPMAFPPRLDTFLTGISISFSVLLISKTVKVIVCQSHYL